MKERKLTDDQVAEIRVLARTPMKKIDIARKYGVSPQLVSTIIRYGYTARPTRERHKKADPDLNAWVDLAKAYTAKYPDDPMSGPEIKAVHDIAIKKIRKYFDSLGLAKNDLI